jgi:hypothetical protein
LRRAISRGDSLSIYSWEKTTSGWKGLRLEIGECPFISWSYLVAAPEVYDQALRLPGGERKLPTLAFLTALSAFLVLLGVGVVRRWRWTFWLVLVAFLIGGVLRVPASILQLSGVLAAAFPAWYVLLQALIGVVQVAIGLLMVVSYRREGLWGNF